ncbi:MAG: hypothetical protein Q8S01_11875, partial [Ignavibacteria bacterium]|nr:hypothetical protein [Ignavibacteria bacterium]
MPSNSEKEEKQIIVASSSALLDAMPVGVLVFDSGYNVSYINSRFANFGILQSGFLENVAGKNLLEEELFLLRDIRNEIKNIKDQRFFEKEFERRQTTNEGEISVSLKCSALFDGELFQGGILIAEEIKVLSGTGDAGLFFQSENFNTILQDINNLFILTQVDGTISYAFGRLF